MYSCALVMYLEYQQTQLVVHEAVPKLNMRIVHIIMAATFHKLTNAHE